MAARSFISPPNSYAALVDPSDGATISALDFRAPNVALINSLARRPETYHASLRNSPPNPFKAPHPSTNKRARKKKASSVCCITTAGRGNSFRLLLFGAEQNLSRIARPLQLEEDAALAGGRYRVIELILTPASRSLRKKAPIGPRKKLCRSTPRPTASILFATSSLRRNAPGAAIVNIGIEVVVNFLAPSTPDRYFESNGQPLPVAIGPPPCRRTSLRVVDEWQRVAVALEAPVRAEFLDRANRNCLRIRRRLRANLSGVADHRRLAGGIASGAEWKGRLIFRAANLD